MSIGRPARLVTAAFALIAWPCGESPAATLDVLGTDGVYTWRVAATDDAPPWIANDRDDDVREGAVFAISQLPGERAVDALFAVLGNRQLQPEVREQALFWLVQSDSDRAFEYLDRLLSSGQ
jgi:HEAT repeat protein